MALNSVPFQVSTVDDKCSEMASRTGRFESFNAYADDFTVESNSATRKASLDLSKQEIAAIPVEDLAQIKRKSNY